MTEFNYLSALVKFMREKKVNVYFDYNSYDLDEDIPQYRLLEDNKIYYVYAVVLRGEDTLVLIGADKDTGRLDTLAYDLNDDTMDVDVIVSVKDGKGSTFAYELYNACYNEICDAEDEDCDDYLEKNCK